MANFRVGQEGQAPVNVEADELERLDDDRLILRNTGPLVVVAEFEKWTWWLNIDSQ